jgi:predicted dehydrogenase
VTAPRVAVVGVVRRRQGFGEYLTRFLVRNGAEVPAFVASRPETIEDGRAVLLRHGVEARGHTSLASVLSEHEIDALVIASPAGTHEPYLRSALDAGLHVLCEKPLVWGGPDAGGRAASLEERFAERGLVLFENCQWPYTLEAFMALHPAAREHPVRHFEMWLSPGVAGAGMLMSSMSHPLSLLQALVPQVDGELPEVGGGLQGLCFSTVDSRAGKLEVSFRYPSPDAGTVVRVRLATCPDQPRPAGYAVNGLAAERRVRLEDYAISFESDGRTVSVPDPMDRLVADFVAAVRSGSRPRVPATCGIGRRLRMLDTIVAGFRHAAGEG